MTTTDIPRPDWKWVGPIAEFVCSWCASFFHAHLGRSVTSNRFCSPECRRARHLERERTRDRLRERSPARVLHLRAQNRVWAAAHRNVTRANPWLRGAPPYSPSLPCVSLDIAVTPLPKWPLSLRNMRGIHGALTTLFAGALGLRHRSRMPTFAPRIHDGTGLRVIVWDDRALGLDGAVYQGTLWDRPTLFRVEDAVEVPAPVVARRGRQRVRLTTVTPVVTNRDSNSGPEKKPTAEGIRNILRGEFLSLFGLERLREGEVQVELLSANVQTVNCELGGKYPAFAGWTGDVELEVNAPTLWLLLAAERVGFGSRAAFGYGQICTEVLGNE